MRRSILETKDSLLEHGRDGPVLRRPPGSFPLSATRLALAPRPVAGRSQSPLLPPTRRRTGRARRPLPGARRHCSDAALARRHPALHAAHQLHRGTAESRLLVEARILAGQPTAAIARATALAGE